MAKILNCYFPHDSNARYDNKIRRLRKVFGVEGYGIYWMLIETLRDQEDYKYAIDDIDLLSDDFDVPVEKIVGVVKNFNLFDFDKDKKFFSISLIARLQPYIEKSKKARLAVNVRWENARKSNKRDTDVLQPYNERSTNRIEENRIEENKEHSTKIDFVTFWDLYDKKVGDKTKLQKKWNKLSLEIQTKH